MIELIETLEEILEIFEFSGDNVMEFEDLSVENRLAIANSISELESEVDYIGRIGGKQLCTNFFIKSLHCNFTFFEIKGDSLDRLTNNPYKIMFDSSDFLLQQKFEKLNTMGCFELLYAIAREAYAQQIYSILTESQRLKILHYAQVGADIEPFEVYANNLLEAHNAMNTLANYDLYQYDNRIKPDYNSCQFLEVYNGIEWCDWIDEDLWTNDVSDLVDLYEEYIVKEDE